MPRQPQSPWESRTYKRQDGDQRNGGSPQGARDQAPAVGGNRKSEKQTLTGAAISTVLPARDLDEFPQGESEFQALVEQSPVIIYWARGVATRQIGYVSPQLETQLGYRPDAWLAGSRGWEAALHPADRPVVLGALAAHESAKSDTISLEYRLTARDGQVHWLRDEARVRWAPGEQAVLHGVLVDVTTQKQAETAARRRNRKLVDHNRLLQSQNEELDAFSHTVAHDLKSPLAVLLGFTEMLQAESETGDRVLLTEGIASIVESARRIDNIIDELLLLADVRRLDEVQRQPLDMAAVVSETLRRVDPLVKGRGATVQVPRIWPQVLGQPGWVQEIWVNYISNAIKYGGRPPLVTLGAGRAAGRMARFWVQDNGPGIDPDHRQRLFTPFNRLDQVRTQGHGLGLSIVRRIATRLGGQVGLDSPNGHGSTFWFTLPLVA